MNGLDGEVAIFMMELATEEQQTWGLGRREERGQIEKENAKAKVEIKTEMEREGIEELLGH